MRCRRPLRVAAIDFGVKVGVESGAPRGRADGGQRTQQVGCFRKERNVAIALRVRVDVPNGDWVLRLQLRTSFGGSALTHQTMPHLGSTVCSACAAFQETELTEGRFIRPAKVSLPRRGQGGFSTRRVADPAIGGMPNRASHSGWSPRIVARLENPDEQQPSA
jgi:hypothetical protein